MSVPVLCHGINYYKALHRKARKRIEFERGHHQDEILRIKEHFRKEGERRYQKLHQRLTLEYTAKVEKLKSDFAAREQVYKATILELKQELSLYTE